MRNSSLDGRRFDVYGDVEVGGEEVDLAKRTRQVDETHESNGQGSNEIATAAPSVDTEPIAEVIRRRSALASVHTRSPQGRGYRIAKRLFDLTVVLLLAPVVVPAIGLIALIIRSTSPGPAIFRQQRVGEGGRLITFCKFRTMYVDARERFPEMYDYSYTAEQFEQLYYKPPVDPRNTPFGRAIRKTTLDELPNLFNVLKGDCSLVGPRPELPELVRYYTPEQLAKFTVKSGVTGLAQVGGRNNLSVQQQIALDVEYVRTQSFWGDIRLILATIVAIVKRVGAE